MTAATPPSNRRQHSPIHSGTPDAQLNGASKRKSTTSAQDEEEDKVNGKKKRRKVNHACVYCRRSHMTCDQDRPCARCIKRDIGHLCHDEPREPSKGSRNEDTVAGTVSATANGLDGKVDVSRLDEGIARLSQAQLRASRGDMSAIDGAGQQIAQPTPMAPAQLQRSITANSNSLNANNFDWNNSAMQNQFQDMHHLHPNYMFNNSEVTNEYNLLNDFLSTSLLDDGALFGNDDNQAFMNDPLLATTSLNTTLNPNFPQPCSQPKSQSQTHQSGLSSSMTATNVGAEIPRPPSTHPASESTLNKFYMTAADPAGHSTPSDRLHKLLRAKYDAGMLKPFNYVRGYARLNAHISAHCNRKSQLRILQQLEKFRPKFREAMQSLTDMQLVLVEMWFERSLMEYDRVFASMAIPACCWRRTGEIFRGNREMAELIQVEWGMLKDGRLALHEILNEESLVSYWEKFGAIAFDNTQKAVLTSCCLKMKGGGDGGGGGAAAGDDRKKKSDGEGAEGGRDRSNEKRCCFSFTIRRDGYNM